MIKRHTKKCFRNWQVNYSKGNHISSRNIFVGDIWLVKFPYNESGNMYKIRPALVTGFDNENDEIIVRKITSNSKNGEYIDIETYKNREIVKNSYLTNNYKKVKDYMCVSKFGKIKKNIDKEK